jgi:hypothetical protein
MPSPEPKSGFSWDEEVGGMNEDENYFFLFAAHLQPLHQSRMSGGVPAQGTTRPCRVLSEIAFA